MAQNNARLLHAPRQQQAASVQAEQTAPNDRAGSQPGDLLLQIRTLLDIAPGALSDGDIEASCLAIQARNDPAARWLTAFNSPLGRWLLIRGSDLNTQLHQLLSVLPPRA